MCRCVQDAPPRTLARCFLVALLLACHAAGAAQVPVPAPRPNLEIWSGGVVRALVELPDGSYVVGGDFESVYDASTGLNFARTSLAKFKANGALDLQWNPVLESTGIVSALALDAAGGLIIAGRPGAVDGLPRPYLARVSASGTGSVDPDWTLDTDGEVRAITVLASGALYIGGSFTQVGDAARRFLAKADAVTGTLDADWQPALLPSGGRVAALAGAPDGALYVGGTFASVNGTPRAHLAKVSGTGVGAVDATWNPSTTSESGYGVEVLLSDPASGLYVGGYALNSVGGLVRLGLARVAHAGAGTVDAGWDPYPGAYVGATSLALSSAGFLYFSAVSNVNVRRISVATGAADPAWLVPHDGEVLALLVRANGRVSTGGVFLSCDLLPCIGLSEHDDVTGAAVPAPYIQANPVIRIVHTDAFGRTYVAGVFARVGNVSRKAVFRLLPDNTLDPDWNPSPDQYISAITTDADGRAYLGGNFTRIGGLDRFALVRLLPDGSVDTGWTPTGVAGAAALELGADGSLYAAFDNGLLGLSRLSTTLAAPAVGDWFVPMDNAPQRLVVVDETAFVSGAFALIGGVARAGLAKVLPNGQVDPSWNPTTTCGVLVCIYALESDGASLYLGGDFASVNGTPRLNIARVSLVATGTVDANWAPSLAHDVRDIVLAPDGALYAGGAYGLSRLLPDASGTVDGNWQPATGTILAISNRPSTDILVGGAYNEINGALRQSLAALPTIVEIIHGDGFE